MTGRPLNRSWTGLGAKITRPPKPPNPPRAASSHVGRRRPNAALKICFDLDCVGDAETAASPLTGNQRPAAGALFHLDPRSRALDSRGGTGWTGSHWFQGSAALDGALKPPKRARRSRLGVGIGSDAHKKAAWTSRPASSETPAGVKCVVVCVFAGCWAFLFSSSSPFSGLDGRRLELALWIGLPQPLIWNGGRRSKGPSRRLRSSGGTYGLRLHAVERRPRGGGRSSSFASRSVEAGRRAPTPQPTAIRVDRTPR